jgi:hypothetical protein
MVGRLFTQQNRTRMRFRDNYKSREDTEL